MRKFKGTENWEIREEGEFFFIQGYLPGAKGKDIFEMPAGHYPRIEVMQEDFGDHNGYTEELRRYDALLISKAPELLKMLERVYNETSYQMHLFPDILRLIKEVTELPLAPGTGSVEN